MDSEVAKTSPISGSSRTPTHPLVDLFREAVRAGSAVAEFELVHTLIINS
jgi:hypothetical protein